MASDPYKYFRVEARELLEQLASGVVAAERDGLDGPAVARLLRFAHTLKGAARVVRQAAIAELAHALEDALAPFRDGTASVAHQQAGELLSLVDGIAEHLRALAPPPDRVSRLAVDDSLGSLRPDAAEMDALLDGLAETRRTLGGLRASGHTIGQALRLAEIVEEGLATLGVDGAEAPSGRRGRARGAARDLRELLAGIEQRFVGATDQLERELQQARRAGERLRLLPVGVLFGSLERLVRDLAQSLGKQASFRARGGETRLDGTVLAALQSALVQAVRNALAHGIEPRAERLANGKPGEGTILVEVVAQGASVVVTCHDDGRGVDLAGVRRRLLAAGTLPPSATPTADELLQVLLRGGISTSATVSDASGRGIGLDVVREVAERLDGGARLETRQGQGTTLELTVPVSLSSLDALLVEAAGVSAVIPVAAVRHTLRLASSDLVEGPETECLAHQGQLIPFVDLGRMLAPDRPAARPRTGVVVGAGGRAAALGVEHVRGRETVLVHPLPELSAAHACVAALFLDRDGTPWPVLAPGALVQQAERAGRSPAAPSAARLPILVVDDSLTTRMLEQSILESAGYDVELAASGEEALERVRRNPYGLLLVDVEMPGMSGFELLERLNTDPALGRIPSILVTSRDSPEDRERSTRAGAAGYVVKSEFDQVDLLRRIRALAG